MSTVARYRLRAAVVAAATLSFAALPAATPAAAAEGGVTQVSPPFVANTGSETPIAFTLSDEPVSPGALLDVTLTGPAGTELTETGDATVDGRTVSAVFDLRGRPPGRYGVRVADPSETVDNFSCSSCLGVLATPPTVSGVSPATRGASSPAATFTVAGTNLFTGVAVRFLRAGAADTAIAYPSTGALSVASDQRSISGQLAVAANAVPGTRDVEVTNTDGQRAVCEACLTITAAPSFVSLSPATAGQGATGRSLALTGAAFDPAMTAAFLVPGSPTDNGGVTVTSFAVGEPDSATIVVNVADRAETTNVTRDLVLTNPDGGTTRVANALTVTPEPRVTSLTPATLDGGASGETLVVTGTGLGAAPDFAFSGSGVTVGGYTPDAATAATRGLLEVHVAPGAALGGRTVTVVNPDGGRSTSADVLTVGATPTVTGVSPPSLGRGAANRTVTISGSGFDTSNGGTNVSVTIPGVTLSGVVATAADRITATAHVPSTAELGVRDVSVLNTASGRRGRATCAACFSVDSFSVDSVTPSAVLNSAEYVLDVTGSRLPTGGTVTATLTRKVARAGQDPVVFGGTVNDDGTRFSGRVDVRAVAPGEYTLRLSDGEASGTCACVFSVAAERAPMLTSVSPSSVPQGSTARELTLRGAGFTRGTDVRLGTGVTKAGPVTFVDTTTLTVPVDVAESATPGAVAVTVLVPGFGSDTEASCASCLTVTRRPAVTSTNRPARGQGAAAVPATVTGSEFQPGATVSLGDGVVVTDVVRVSATTLSFSVAVAGDAVPGPREITVTNPDGGAGTCACFAVTPRPQATSVSPPTGGQGLVDVPVTLTGTGFQNAATVSFGPDVRVYDVAVSPESITARLDLRAAGLGEHAVSVSNPDGGEAGCACAFTVHVVPTLATVTPASRGAGAVGEAMTLTGTSFTDAATVAVTGAGVSVTGVRVVDATRIEAVVAIAPDAITGPRGVTVTNADTGQSASCSGCFTVNPGARLDPVEHSVQRNRRNVTLSLTGAGFHTGPVTALLGDGITVTNATATSPTAVTVTYDVGPSAALGAHDVTVVNPDGGRATCASCLTVTTPRAFTIDVPATPRSGAAQTVTVTARRSSDGGAATDTSYTGVPVLSAAGDGRFAPGTCSAAVSGVSTCRDVVFGDLGSVLLNAAGTGADDDLGGTREVTVQPVSLVFSPAPPRAVRAGSPASFTVRPVAGVAGASIDGYDAARTAHVTGGSAPAVPLDCDSAVCTFSLTFADEGRKTVRVTDDGTPSLSTPTANVTAQLGTYIAGYRVSPTSQVAGSAVTVYGTLRDSRHRPLAGHSVTVYVAGYGAPAWSGWFRTITDSQGRIARPATVTRTWAVKATYHPSSDLYTGTETRPVTVQVATRVTITSPRNGAYLAAGRTFTVQGTTYPAKPGVRLNLVWRRSDGSYASLGGGYVGRDGRFAVSRSLPRGTYTIQVWVAAAAGNAAGRSQLVTLRVV